MGKRFTIGVLIGNAHTSHPKGLIKGICDNVVGKDANVVFFLATQSTRFYKELVKDTIDYDYQYSTIYDYALLAKIDVLIIAYGSLCIFEREKNKQKFLNRFPDIPYVLLADVVETEIMGKRGVHIIADNYGGMKECMEHLIIKHGYRKILYLSGPGDNKDAMERLSAYRDTLNEYHIPIEEDMIAYGNYTEYIDEEVEKLLDLYPDAEAIVAANDEMAMGIYRVCNKRNLQVGRDIAVTGFDDVEMAKYIKPSLTTISQNSYVMGRMAVQKAMQICNGDEAVSSLMKVEFVPRESCGCKGMNMMDKLLELKKLSDRPQKDISETVDELKKFQHKSWLGPYMIRDLMLVADDEKIFYSKAVQILHKMGAKSSYLYLLKKPIKHREGDEWKVPNQIYLVAKQSGEIIESYNKEERSSISKKDDIMQIMNFDNETHVYMNFLLFEGAKQYGFLTLEIKPEDIALFYMITLQLGTSIRFLEMTQKQKAYRQRLKEKNELLNFIAVYDQLTGIYNRRGIMESLVKFNNLHRGKNAYILVGDLDHLKEINDTFGHGEGDCAIRTTAGILKEVVGKTGEIGRIGGDEFVSIFLLRKNMEKDKYIEYIYKECEIYNKQSNKPYYVNISLGVVDFECGEHVDFKVLLKKADEKLYIAKKHRRSSIKKA